MSSSNLTFNASHSINYLTAPTFVPPELLVSSATLYLFGHVFDTWFSLLVCLVGLVTNVIDIIIFWRMGYKETVNITMSAIAFWDVVKVMAGMTSRFYGPISVSSAAFGKSWENITFTKLLYVHVLSGNVSFVMGGYVAIERCLCVSRPFTVRSLLTPKTTFAILIFISIFVFGSLTPMLNIFEFKWVYSEDFGTSIAIYDYTDFYYGGGKIFLQGYKVLNFIYPMLRLLAMVTCTIIILYQLRRSTQFRASMTLSGGQDRKEGQAQMSTRDKQVLKMLLVVIVLFIASLIPRFVHYTTMLAVPEYYYLKRFHNIFWVIVYIVAFADFLNASLNMFVFLSMCSGFRNVCYETFYCNISRRKQKNVKKI